MGPIDSVMLIHCYSTRSVVAAVALTIVSSSSLHYLIYIDLGMHHGMPVMFSLSVNIITKYNAHVLEPINRKNKLSLEHYQCIVTYS